ncbi:UNVERIFIED_CONTAM: hypothetical protein GTU68_001342, partial [Idotea baltica]|nr:hypothetical protein [Idotea baltica]
MSFEIKIPSVGESISEVTVGQWLVEDGAHVEMDDPICELESEKATFELNAEVAGTLKQNVKEGDVLNIGDIVGSIDENEKAANEPAKDKKSAQIEEEKSEISGSSDSIKKTGKMHPSPAAGKILAEKGIQTHEVKGTGVDGRITKEDAQKAQKIHEKSAPTKEESKVATPAGARDQRREKMTTLRKTISRRLVSVKNETAMLTTFNEVNMKPIMDIRSKYKEQFKEKHEIGLGFMSFFTKACCVALKEWPAVNAFIDGEEIVYSDYCDISIAV